jgi:hypothetical protein
VTDIDLVDSTWIGVRPGTLAPDIADPRNWRRWWPELDLQVSEARGAKGVRWLVHDGRRSSFAGSMEIWLQPVGDGTVAHYFLRVDRLGAAARAPLRRVRNAHLVQRYRARAKRVCWELSDRHDPGRLNRVAAPRPMYQK